MPNRIEREIEEILTRLDEFVPNERRSRRMRRRIRAHLAGFRERFRVMTRGLTGGHIVLIAGILLVVSIFLHGAFPTLALWITYLCLAVIFGAIFLSIRPFRRRQQQYWRGQPVNLRGPGPIQRLQAWWRRRNRRRW